MNKKLFRLQIKIGFYKMCIIDFFYRLRNLYK